MQTDHWMLLTDYASKYRISVSTLRRRIKTGQIQYRFESGKYYIYDAPLRATENPTMTSANLTFPGIRPVPAEAVPLAAEAELKLRDLGSARPHGTTNSPASAQDSHQQNTNYSPDVNEPIISSATRLLDELKRAYMNILHEKEEQIIQLKEEVSDLNTLVRALEDDNDRMRRFLTQHQPTQ